MPGKVRNLDRVILIPVDAMHDLNASRGLQENECLTAEANHLRASALARYGLAQTCVILQEHGDDGRADLLRGVDDFFDARHSEGDVHGGDAGEVKGLQGHLSSGLTDALCAKSPDGGARFHCGWKSKHECHWTEVFVT